MMWYYGASGMSWFWMTVTMLGMALFWGGVLALVIWAVRRFGTPASHDGALDILRRRLAAGEITPEQFEATKKALGA